MKCIIVAVFLFGIFLPSTHCRHAFYRRDYTYIHEYDAFYKVHWDVSGTEWNTAFTTCDDEGAALFYPKDQGEWALVKILTEKMTEAPNVTEIFVGLHDKFKLGEFITIDGHPTPHPLPTDRSLHLDSNNCITMNIDTGKFTVDSCSRSGTPLPFVCRKIVEDPFPCPTVDLGYKYSRESKKCYKINKKPQKWQDAMKTCFMEGGILAVIENTTQAEEIRNIVVQRQSYFVGVRKLFNRGDYYTVKSQKFSDMYQRPYSNGQNSYNNDENGQYPDENGQYPDENGQHLDVVTTDCGTVCQRDNGYLYTETRDCDDHLPFICEMEVGE